MGEEAAKLKRSRSMSLHDTLAVTDEKPKADKDKRSHRHHHKRHHHARHLKNKGLNAHDTLELRIRSGMHALEEERKALREIVDEIETFGEKDREDINSKVYFHFSSINRVIPITETRRITFVRPIYFIRNPRNDILYFLESLLTFSSRHTLLQRHFNVIVTSFQRPYNIILMSCVYINILTVVLVNW